MLDKIPMPAPPGQNDERARMSHFHRYSVARESTVQHYSGARADMTRNRYSYRGGRTGCAYNPLWLEWPGGWVEIGVAHHCLSGSAMQVYAYRSCGGRAGFVGHRALEPGRGRVVLAVERTRQGYVWKIDGHVWQRRRLAGYCLAPDQVETGLESYSSRAKISHEVVRGLAYKHDGHWHRWHGHDYQFHGTGMSGRWIGPNAWAYSERVR